MKKEASEQTTVSGQKPLFVILSEIEERAKNRMKFPYCCISQDDVPGLVKALRESRILYLTEVGADSWEHKNFDRKIAAILNQK